MKRDISDPIEAIIGVENKVLDKGFISVVDYMGCDSSIVDAARVSYGSGTKKSRDNAKLIEYLLRNSHMSPFEMCEIKFHVKLPLFVARQWVRHRTANVNEQSARYSIVENEFYVPHDFKTQSKINHQASDKSLGDEFYNSKINEFVQHCNNSFELYNSLISSGVSREISRMILPVNVYTQWYWKIDLRNLLNFVTLRISDNAQYEIREYAKVILEILRKWVPITTDAFEKYHINTVSLYSDSISMIKDSIKLGKIPEMDETKLTKSEYNRIRDILL